MTVACKMTLIAGLIAAVFFPSYAREWDDLREKNDGKLYGSEKAEKIPVDAGIFYKEDWLDHYSLMFLGIYKYTDYPKYHSTRVLPFWYGLDSKIDNRSFGCIPLFFSYWETDGTQKFRINPFFVDESNNDNQGQYRSNFSLFHFYENRTAQDGTFQHTAWFPIIPAATYVFESQKGGHRNIAGIVDYEWESNNGIDSVNRAWLAPFFFWKSSRYTMILPPLYIDNTTKDSAFFVFLPAMYFHNTGSQTAVNSVTAKSETAMFDLSVYSPLFVRYTERNSEKKITESRTMIPALPFIYYSSEKEGSNPVKNLFTVINWRNRLDGEIERLWVHPLTYWESSSYFHILPPLYMSFTGNDYTYSHLLPFFAVYGGISEKDKDGSVYYTDRTITPLFVSSSRRKDSASGDVAEKSLFFPIIPLYYSSKNTTETHTNIFWLFDWAKAPDGGLDRLWISPLVYYRPGEGKYKVIVPFYVKPSGWTEAEGCSFGLFHYNAWSPDRGRTLVWPVLHYTHDYKKEKNYVNIWAPLYFNAESDKRNSTLFLPLYFNTENVKTGKKIHVNILGISRSIAAGYAPVAEAGIESDQYGYYIDFDFSWLYDVVSVSSRKRVYEKMEKFEEPERKDVSLAEKSSLSRENSANYFGYRMFFGLLDVKAADTRRHFRMLPLTYLTWDTASDDSVFWAFNTVKYNNGAGTDYFVCFPFYGYQHQGASYRYAYLGNIFWREYDDEEKRYEKTVLWPIVNWYESPAEAGVRAAPIFWKKQRVEGDVRYSSLIIPLLLYFGKTSENAVTGEVTDKTMISPFNYYSYTQSDSAGSTRYFYPIIPLLYHSDSLGGGFAQSYNHLLPVYFSASEKKEDGKAASSYVLIPPLLYYSSENSITGSDGTKSYSREKFAFGYASSESAAETSYSFAGLFGQSFNQEKNIRITRALFGLYSDSQEGNDFKNRFLPFWYSSSSPDETFLIAGFGLYYKSSDKNANVSRLFPFYYSRTSPNERELSFLLGFVSDKKTTDVSGHDVSVLWNLAGYESVERKNKESGAVDYSRSLSWFFPFFHVKSAEWTESSRNNYLKEDWSIFYHRNDRAVDSISSEYTFWAPIIPAFYYHSERNYTHWNTAIVFDYIHRSDQNETKFWAAPLFFMNTGSGGYVAVLPVFYRGWDDASGENSIFAAGYYHTSAPGYERRNLLYLYDRIHMLGSHTESTSLLFHLLSKENTKETVEYSFIWGAGADYTVQNNQKGYSASVLLSLGKVERDDDSFHSRLLPVWYYSSDSESSRIAVVPLLSYHSTYKNGDSFTIAALGALYYRNLNQSEKTDHELILAGIIYEKTSKPERGYSSSGVLWGWLFEYSEESETDFKQYSVLKGAICKRTFRNGTWKNTLFGLIEI